MCFTWAKLLADRQFFLTDRFEKFVRLNGQLPTLSCCLAIMRTRRFGFNAELRQKIYKAKQDNSQDKTSVINDPLGQTHNPTSSDLYSHLNIALFCSILKSWEGWTTWVKIEIVGQPSGSIGSPKFGTWMSLVTNDCNNMRNHEGLKNELVFDFMDPASWNSIMFNLASFSWQCWNKVLCLGQLQTRERKKERSIKKEIFSSRSLRTEREGRSRRTPISGSPDLLSIPSFWSWSTWPLWSHNGSPEDPRIAPLTSNLDIWRGKTETTTDQEKTAGSRWLKSFIHSLAGILWATLISGSFAAHLLLI